MLSLLLEPLTLLWFGVGAWLVMALRRRQWPELLLAAGAWTLLTLCTCTPLPSLLLSTLETEFPRPNLQELEQGDVIVCLGGGASPAPFELTGIHLREAADRISTSLLLARAGKAPVLVMGGGGYMVDGEWRSEADAVSSRLREAMLPNHPVEVISLGICSDTHDEVLKVQQFRQTRQWKRVFVVSSAYHLPRAMATFRCSGIDAIPVPCNYVSAMASGQRITWFGLPRFAGLSAFHLWWHECVGSCYYRSKGWI